MAQDVATSGGGLHPGQPVLWPTGKNTSSPVKAPGAAEATGGARNIAGRVSPTRPGEVSAPGTTAPTAPTAAPARPVPAAIARALTVQDIRSHLLNIQVEPTDFNMKLSSLMLRYGLEISRENFVQVLNSLQGTNYSQAMQEAAILNVMKGVDSPQATQILGQYFTENPGLANQVLGLQEAVGNLNSALGLGKGLLDVNLISQLASLLSQFDDSFKSLAKKFSGSGSSEISVNEMVNNVRTLKALLQGIQEKAPSGDGAETQVLSSSLSQFQGKLDGILDNFLSQAILSQSGRSEVNYLYQQIPNAMTTPPKDFEIVIKRDGEGKQARVDPRNTQVVMSLETQNMGKMVVSMLVKDGKVYLVFVFAEKDYGDDGRGMIAKEFGSLQEQLGNKNYLITGYQVKVDPAMVHIKPYLIPMLPKLEALLKRIDIEA